MSNECEYMTPFGCPARDSAKELVMGELIEGSSTYKDIKDICKKECCKECEETCGYRCGRC